RQGGHTPRTKINAGLIYFVVNAVGVALLNTWARPIPFESSAHVSWNAVVILVASMILPATPMQILAASMIAASTDPLGVWVAHLRGLPAPSIGQAFVLFMPNYACAVVATLPSHVLHRMGRQIRHARALGSYHLIELLGRGGMGEVWRARHHLLARSAA